MDKEVELHMEDKEAKDRAESQENKISDVLDESVPDASDSADVLGKGQREGLSQGE